MPLLSQNTSAYFKNGTKKLAAKIIFFSPIRTIFYVVSEKVIFTTVRNIYKPKNGFEIASDLSLLA